MLVLNKDNVMVNFMCQLDSVIGFADIWLTLFLSVSVRVFLDEISISTGGVSKEVDCSPQCRWTLSNPFEDLTTAQYGERKNSSFFFSP